MPMQLVVLGATRRNPLYSKVTDHDINTVAQNWLKSSCDRDGGRKSRLLHAAANKEKGKGKQKEATSAQQTEELESLEEQSE